MSVSQSKFGPLAFLAAVALAAALISAVVAVDVDAARGARGGGGKGGKGGGSTATMTVSPNPVPLGSTGITITGSGFGANQEIYLDVSGWFPSTTVTTDGSGSFSLFYSHTYTGGGNSFVTALNADGTVLATAYYTVCSTDPC